MYRPAQSRQKCQNGQTSFFGMHGVFLYQPNLYYMLGREQALLKQARKAKFGVKFSEQIDFSSQIDPNCFQAENHQ